MCSLNIFTGVVLSQWDSHKPSLHFAHANGFPAGSYRQLFEHLQSDFNICAIEMFGHHPHKPVSANWQNQVDELIHYLEQQNRGKVYAVGHSFGGVVSFKAVCQRPDLFAGLIMLDPPLLTGLTAKAFRFFKKTPIIDRLTPAGKSKIRNHRWLNSESLVDYFASKPLFKGITKSVIQDYVDAGTYEKAGYRQLVFNPQVETALFRNIPHNLSEYKGKLEVPALLITAEHTHICKPFLIDPFLKMNPHIEHQAYQGVGHLFPFQQPQHTATYITEFIKRCEEKA